MIPSLRVIVAPDVRLAPGLEHFLVVAVQGVQRVLERQRQVLGVESRSARGPPSLGHLPADVLPEFPVHRYVGGRQVVRYRHPRELDDAALDGVHQREVAHRPRKQRALGIARAAQEEGRCREIEHAAQPQTAVNALQPGNPHPRRFLVRLRLLKVVVLRLGLLRVSGPFPVAVMGLVVEDHDVLHAHQVGNDPLEHLAFRFERVRVFPAATSQEGTSAFRQGHPFTPLEGVKVRDYDLRAVDIRDHVRGNQSALPVVVVGIVGLEHPQPIADRQARGHDQEAAGEGRAPRPADRVDGLPRDQHRHDHRLAGAGGELERQPRQIAVLGVDFLQPSQKAASPRVPPLRSHFRQPDSRLHRLHLAEEGSNVVPAILAPPVLQESRRLGRHLPLLGARELAPAGDFGTQVLNHPRQVELRLVLFPRGQFQLRAASALLWGGNGRIEADLPAGLDQPVRRLAVAVELPVARRRLVWGVEDRLFEELRVHLNGALAQGRETDRMPARRPAHPVSDPTEAPGRGSSAADRRPGAGAPGPAYGHPLRCTPGSVPGTCRESR